MSARLESYLQEYGASHRHPVNIRIHELCVPAISWATVGLAHSLAWGPVRASYPFVLGVLLFYGSLRAWRTLAAAAVVLALCLASYSLVPQLPAVAGSVFAVGWVLQFYGHKVEGRKPSFLRDVFFLLIGPAWCLRRQLGV